MAASRVGPPGAGAHMTTTTLKVEGMTCGACTSAVESAFNDVQGVGSVSVSLVMERAVVMHDAARIAAEQIREMIEDRGFDANIISSDAPNVPLFDADDELEDTTESMDNGISTTILHVGGMTCGACTSAVEGAFKNVSGVKTFNISLLSERAVIEHDPSILAPEKLAEIIEDTGFDAEIIETKQTSSDGASRTAKIAHSTQQQGLVTTTVAIDGMTCGACTSAVEGGFKGLPGVLQFNISLLAERAVILHNPAILTTGQIVETIEDRGFDARIVSSVEEGVQTSTSSSVIQLKLFGLPSPESAADLQQSLSSMAGITSANIDFATSRATISHIPAQLGLRAIVEAIEKAGCNALVADSDDNNAQLESLAKTKEIQEWYRAFRTSLGFAIPVFLISMIFPMFIPALNINKIGLPIPGLFLGDVICLLLTIPVQFGIGKRFYVSSWKSIKHGSPTMDVLVTLGTSAAFFFSCAAMIVSVLTLPHSRPATTFDTSTMLITYISLGRFLENRAKGQTSKALSRLMSLAPSTATIYADSIAAAKAAEAWDASSSMFPRAEKQPVETMVEERTVPTELIEVGDIVVLKPGDKIPADGIVLRGESFVDESMVTGEAMPILKKQGTPLMAGTVNGAGRLELKVTRAGRDTQLSQIVRLVQEAQTSRAPIQRMADVVAGYFVPIIITLGLATFIGWMVLSHILPNPPQVFLSEASGGRIMVCVKLCIAVIVFACPCALGLATPTAVMVGTGVGAEQGILIKGGAALEKATKVKHVVLDKTGTLTFGKMSVSDSELLAPWNTTSEQRLLWWNIVGLAETGSEHPIATAIVANAKGRLGIDSEAPLQGSAGDFKAIVGKGIAASVEPAGTAGRKRFEALIGNAAFLRGRGVDVPETSEQRGNDLRDVERQKTADQDDEYKLEQNAGTTKIYVAIDGEYAGSLGLSDTLKPSAAACIAALHRMGITTSLVTGDQAATARYVASLVNISPENVFAGVLPSGKQAIIEDLQKGGQTVAMVGDGINDSPALATANIGISFANGTDVAMEAADFVLMKPNQLMDIPASLHLCRTIFHRIKLNLLLSCIYNVIGLPIAMGFLLPWGISLPPLAAGAAMACSSVTVVVSSLLLKLWHRPRWMLEEDVAAWQTSSPTTIGSGIWNSILAASRAVLGRGRRRAEGQRGAYVALENYEAV
ncbi:E1-E2 ATPase-domain-containing protein [Neohortaea acidophila]|uniref:P-type Cu(+) transporter n=1 Tax=Neohortaea acidophila TaxID=245834 RepID=A0A6A6PT40_9PEZI|nr:E1-E2 ATPase-domain-containing protein [Neohortaea acidophila]KAF2483270.1 E1-E2 ATPase-domain-containing protein [Neohortaea acidophila]